MHDSQAGGRERRAVREMGIELRVRLRCVNVNDYLCAAIYHGIIFFGGRSFHPGCDNALCPSLQAEINIKVHFTHVSAMENATCSRPGLKLASERGDET